MSLITGITMIFVVGIVWGGLAFLIKKAFYYERKKLNG